MMDEQRRSWGQWLVVAVICVAAGVFTLRMLSPAPQDSGVTREDTGTWATPAPYEGEVFATIAAVRGIMVHCGNSMRPAVEAIAAEFQRRTGTAVRLNFGGSAELLASIATGRQGDLYVCHDPYAERLADQQLLVEYETVGALIPIIVVPSGNHHGITTIRDLVTPGLRLALPDARYATAGKLVRAALREQGLEEAVDANLRMEGRGHNDVATAVLSGQADAGIVWNFIAHFYVGRLERVDTGLDLPPTRVTICLLTTATEQEAAREFMALAASEYGREVFARHGYTVAAAESSR